jgi:DNA-binding NtrC family response regulator
VSLDSFVKDMILPTVGGAEIIKAASVGNHYLLVICISEYTPISAGWNVESMDNVYFLLNQLSLKQLLVIVKNSFKKSS